MKSDTIFPEKNMHFQRQTGFKNKPDKIGSSFMWAGFECTSALNKTRRLNILQATRHDVLCREDYSRLKELGITTVREGLSWAGVHTSRESFDFTRYERMMQIGREESITQIWDLNHFDYPEWLDSDKAGLLQPWGSEMFVEYAVRAVRTLATYIEGPLWIVPWNEPSFYSWIAGEMGVWAPFLVNQGWDLKYSLVRMMIRAMRAMRDECPRVRFMHTDPVMYRKPLYEDRESKEKADFFNEIRFQSWDMLLGMMCPELGGSPDLIDAIGANCYIQNVQWVKKNRARPGDFIEVSIALNNPRNVRLCTLLQELYERYGKDIVIAETGSFGAKRAIWWKYALREIDKARACGVPIKGICAYPILDDPNWHDNKLNNSGAWDFMADDRECARIPHEPTQNILRRYIRRKC